MFAVCMNLPKACTPPQSYYLRLLADALGRAASLAVAAGIGEHTVSDINHALATVRANMEER